MSQISIPKFFGIFSVGTLAILGTSPPIPKVG